MSEDPEYTDGWTDHPKTIEVIKDLKRQLQAQVELLISNAEVCNEPTIRSNWTAIAVLKRVIADLEAERGK